MYSFIHFSAPDPPRPSMTDINVAFAQLDIVVTKALSVVKDNIVLMLFVAGGLLVLGMRVFKKAKKAVR